MRSSLSRGLGRTATPADAISELAGAAWRARGLALIDPAAVADPWVRQAIVNEAVRLYGPRPTQPLPKEGNPS